MKGSLEFKEGRHRETVSKLADRSESCRDFRCAASSETLSRGLPLHNFFSSRAKSGNRNTA